MRRILVIVLAFGCGGRAPEAKQGGGHVATHPAAGPGPGSAVPPPVVLPDVGCLTTSCAFHAGGAAYFTCLAGGAGTCFHFGGPCTPPDACMYDPADRSYKQCQRPVEGTCQQWAAACAPKSACMFDPADGMHHHCDELAGGACKRYGALCAP